MYIPSSFKTTWQVLLAPCSFESDETGDNLIVIALLEKYGFWIMGPRLVRRNRGVTPENCFFGWSLPTKL